MQKTATTLKFLSILGLIAGVVMSFVDMSFGAIAFLCSIAFAHIAFVLRSDKHSADMEETLSILMNLSAQSKGKTESLPASGHEVGDGPIQLAGRQDPEGKES